MFSRLLKLVRNYLLLSVSDKYKNEFEESICKINIIRGKIVAIGMIACEMMMLTVSWSTKEHSFFMVPNIYYGTMYILMIIVMAIHLLLFIKFEKNLSKYKTSIMAAGISFLSFVLLWCAAISLLDQLSYGGQIIVYTTAIIFAAVVPLYKPPVLLFIYLTVHILFLNLIFYFQKSSELLFGNCINSTTFLILSWVISLARYKSQIEIFNNRKANQEKSIELKRVNQELEETNKKLEKLSQTDGLTGIFNRLAFDKAIKSEWDRCKRYSITLSLIMIDIDFFKAFNDNYGHQLGDNCIKKVAEVLSDCARRSSDIVTRYGGEEFAIILPHMNKEDALQLAEGIRSRIEELNISHEYSSVSNHVTISLGVNSVIPSDKLSIEEFIKATDKALYEAKDQNRNNTVVAWQM